MPNEPIEPGGGYDVTYYRNYNSSDSTTAIYSGVVLVSIETLGFTAPQGYQFKEWNMNRDGTGDSYSVGDPCPIAIVYAMWEPADVVGDFITTGTELQSIARAIRDKGGTFEYLEYPDGFVDAINDIPTGVTPTGTYHITVSSSGTRTTNVTNYANVEITVPAGSAGTPTATKGTVSNHAISITPSVTNTAGYITGATINGTAVSVSASELVSGSLNITENGTGIDVTNYASVNVSAGPTSSDAVLTVTVTHGSSVIAEKGTSTLSPVIWTTSENSALDNAIFIINPSMFDSTAWTITATLSGDTISDTITINSNLQYTLDLVRLYLYKDGEEYTSYTGGWSQIPVSGATVTKNDNNIYMKAASATASRAVVQTENPLDCTRYSTLHFIVTDTQSQASILGLVSVKGSYAESDFIALETINNVGASYHVIVSISNLTGSYYPTVQTRDYSADRFYIYRVWAEC